MNEYEKATKYFEKAIEMEAENVEWRNYIGGLYLEKKDYDKARVHLVESLRLNPEIFDTHLKLAQLCVADDMEEEAYVHIKHALNLNPDHEGARTLYAQLKKKRMQRTGRSSTKSPTKKKQH